MKKLISVCALLALGAVGCGGGLPIKIVIDDFGEEINLDETAEQLENELINGGLLPPDIVGLPELWPDSLPAVQFTTSISSPAIPIDLTPEPGDPNEGQYDDINRVDQAIRRIEVNQLVMRVERNTTPVDLPEIFVQVADDPDADPDDNRNWFTVGRIVPAGAGFVGDIEMEFLPGGESLMSNQLADEEKEFAIRTVGRLTLDTETNPNMPRGIISTRLIVVATFFVEPEELL